MFLMRTSAKSLASETQNPTALIVAADSPWNGSQEEQQKYRESGVGKAIRKDHCWDVIPVLLVLSH